MTWLFRAFRWRDLAFAIGSAVAFVAALVAGLGLEALAFLGAGIWWLLFNRYWAGKARAAARHREPNASAKAWRHREAELASLP